MANRAYLYSQDFKEVKDFVPERDYYDSRWDIPLAWFFFFSSKDLVLVDKFYEDSMWQEVKLVALKIEAVALFQNRLPILKCITKQHIKEHVLLELLEIVQKWTGNYLVFDPLEVQQDDDLDFAARLFYTFDLIDSFTPVSPPTKLLENLQTYCHLSNEKKDYPGRVVGYTYW